MMTPSKPEQRKIKKKCSMKPQSIDLHSWYYEYPSRIHLIHESKSGEVISIRIPKRILLNSLERMGFK